MAAAEKCSNEARRRRSVQSGGQSEGLEVSEKPMRGTLHDFVRVLGSCLVLKLEDGHSALTLEIVLASLELHG